MAVYKCKSCGASLEVNGNESVITCDYCDVVNTIPKVQDENLQGLYNRANTLRLKSEFDKAEKLYEKIIESDSTQAEAYWGLILCRYGIEYVEDDKTFKRIPTCHRTSFESIAADEDYKSALMYADSIQRMVYEADAREIDRIQKEILAISSKEEPYDVFICYKQTDETGKRTKDSALGNEIYHQLTQEGYKVFYAAITLEDKLGSEYEPIIFAALNSAKIMLVIGTKPEYFNAVWVKNEWSRFMKIMKKDRSKKIFPCYMNMDAYDLPDEFSNLQAQDMSSMAFIPDLVRNIKKIIVKDNSPAVSNISYQAAASVTSASPNIEPLLKRAAMYLEDRDFASADEYCEKVLDQDPENAKAYLYKLLASLKLTSAEKLASVKGGSEVEGEKQIVTVSRIYGQDKISIIKVIREIAGWGLKEAKDFIDAPDKTHEFTITSTQAKSLSRVGVAVDIVKVLGSVASIESIESNNNYKKFLRFASENEKAEIVAYIEKAKDAALLETRKVQYNEALSLMHRARDRFEYAKAADAFDAIGYFEDAADKADECRQRAIIAGKEAIYTAAKDAIRTKDIERLETSLEDLGDIIDYKDAYEIRASIPGVIESINAEMEEARKNSEYEYAIRALNKNKIDDILKAIEALESLGDYKDAPAKIVELKNKLDEINENRKEKALRSYIEEAYNREYPIITSAEKVKKKHQECVDAFNTASAQKKNDGTIGCSIAAIIFTLIGLGLIFVGMEEDYMFVSVIGAANAILMPVGLRFVLKGHKEKIDNAKTARNNLEAAERDLKALNAVPDFEKYYAEKLPTLSQETKDKILAKYETTAKSDNSLKKENNSANTEIKCRMCGAVCNVKANDRNAKCTFFGAKLYK